ncbi:MAG: AraC family transcriptional regulator ligand-binding domain-containing protein [Myxococcota bacterium]
MTPARGQGFRIGAAWKLVLAELGIDGCAVLRRARLPADLFDHQEAVLAVEQKYALWRALEAEAPDPLLPLRLVQSVRPEVFDPPVFAALCSPNLRTALERLRLFKPVISAMRMVVDVTPEAVDMHLVWPPGPMRPRVYALTELAFFVSLARTATRTEIRPLRVELAEPPPEEPRLHAHFGVPLCRGFVDRVVFDRADAELPFLTANDAMFAMLETQLKLQLDPRGGEAEGGRVRRALLEALPAGRTSIDHVAAMLGTSRRTLQRRLDAEGTTFSALRDDVRNELSRRYLAGTQLTFTEIAFLLGYEEPSSFFRAYLRWSGETPESTRRRAALDAGASAE